MVIRQVAQAWGAGDWQAAQARACALAAAQGEAPRTEHGLDSGAWQRLVVLASFATPLPHAQAALLPLRVLPPNRVRVINPVQALQVMLTLQFSQARYARRLLGLAALVPGAGRTAGVPDLHAHPAGAAAGRGAAATPLELRQAMEDTWADVLVQRRWQRLAGRLDAAACELLLQRASQRGLVVGGGRWLSADAAHRRLGPGRAGAARRNRCRPGRGSGHRRRAGRGRGSGAGGQAREAAQPRFAETPPAEPG